MQIVNRLSATPLPRRPNFFAERGKNGSCARRAARRRTFRPNEPAARAARNLCKQKAPSPRGPDPLKLRRAKPRFYGNPFLKNSSASKTTLLLLKLLSRAGFPCAASRAVEPALARKFPHNGKFPCEQMAKSPPGSLQESICSHSICPMLRAYCQIRTKKARAKKQFRCTTLTPRREDFPKGKICGEISSRNLFCEAKEIREFFHPANCAL